MLFNVKHSPNGEVKGFKLCVVMETADKAGDEKRIYLDIDSDIPFDVLVYTPREWDALLLEQHSFANRIMREGTCVYDSGPQ